MPKNVAVYAGTFDPFTNGHLDIVQRSSLLFDEIHLLVGVNSRKQSYTPLESRLQAIQVVVFEMEKVKVVGWSELVVDYLKKVKANVLIRGVRNQVDFENEMQLASINRHLYAPCETLFIPCGKEFTWLSSTVVKELIHFEKNVAQYVPPAILSQLKKEGLICLD